MNIDQLCKAIHLQSEIEKRVIAFSDSFDFKTIEYLLKDFTIYEKMDSARKRLQIQLGEDEDNIKILACMLKASADVYTDCQEKGIDDTVYFDTMRCYTRFIEETYHMTGKLSFDRFWWTTRQAGCHLFRIGALEYEMKPLESRNVVAIHIPSDTDLSPSSVGLSLKSAKDFFLKHYPHLSDADFRCHSWLLDPQLNKMLKENSNIRNFQRRFEIFDKGEISSEFLQWLFQTDRNDYTALPENTSLQRNMKKHLLSGGVIYNAYGILRS